MFHFHGLDGHQGRAAGDLLPLLDVNGDHGSGQRREQRALLRTGAHLQGIFGPRHPQHHLPPGAKQVQVLTVFDDPNALHLPIQLGLQHFRAACRDAQSIFPPRQMREIAGRRAIFNDHAALCERPNAARVGSQAPPAAVRP